MNPNFPAQSQKSLTIKVPGKLYIAGEYAVLAPNQPAILLALDQYLELKITKRTGEHSLVENHQADYPTLGLAVKEEALTQANQPPLTSKELSKWRYVIQAIKVAKSFLQECGIDFQAFHLQIQSHLMNKAGLKYGLGSSGAVTVGTLKALLAFHDLKITPEKLYRLAVISQLQLGTAGSFGDLAANSFGGWIYYQAPERNALQAMMTESSSITNLLNCEWPSLVIERLEVPTELQLLIGWTQQPASTDNLVNQLLDQVKVRPQPYQAFLDQAQSAVLQLKEGLIENHPQSIDQAINAYRDSLEYLSGAYDLSIETNSLTKLITIANNHHYAAKSSGAGGGDCGIALGFDLQYKAAIVSQWQTQQIIPLDLGPAPQIS
ncbi:phosphomevalonate kinase [Facklamia miroungae]|uniref:phosphomevalonate kinase n=1 Tax=Facklamia miroungae TaxID=120956 RepID=A0A1G7RG52_9LACT|nr:phosphomevalonate kinase [Facklamia miroungae]NKZ29425.1 phosphomevalonate kinase [Facklamia miroungae]SDG09748.1 phosphomevalonate kinase [Facklamia miroungae]